MRKILLLSALLLSGNIYAGENDMEPNVTGAPTVGGLFPHFGLGRPNAVLPGNQRLIAKAYARFNSGSFMPVDSITYQYSNGRGSVPDPENVNSDDHVLFDISTTYAFNGFAAIYENSRQRTQHFTGNKVDELVYKKWHSISSSWKNAERYLYTYDYNGKMHSSVLQQWYGTLWTNGINSVLNYDQNNNVVQMNSSTYTIDFMYDQDNNLVMIEDKIWTQGAGWSKNERKNYEYDGDDVSEYILKKWVNGSWQNSGKWEYSYDAKANVILSTEYTWNLGWQKAKQEAFVYDANDNMLEKIEKKWNSTAGAFDNSKKEVRTYNSNDLPVSVTSFTADGAGWIHADGDIVVRYYYEQYFPASINRLTAGLDMAIYPLPATDNMNISFKLDQAEDFSVVLTDMAGKTLYTEHVQSGMAYNSRIPVHNLPAGTYILHVDGGNVNMTKKVSVMH
ncbi:MAG TPA: T9SS type A sorting domain-containing protein [Flavipsychrobacter sp.]